MRKNNTTAYFRSLGLLLSLGVLVFFISIPEVFAKETYSNQEILQWKYNQKKKEAEVKYNIQKQKELTQKKIEVKKTITPTPKKTTVKTPVVKKTTIKKTTPKQEIAPVVKKLPQSQIIETPKKQVSTTPKINTLSPENKFSLSNKNTKRYLITYKKNQTPKTNSTVHTLKKRLRLNKINVDIVEATEAEINSLKKEGLEVIPDVAMQSTSIDEYNTSWGVKKIGAENLHNLGIKGAGIKVAIIDSGVDYTHPEIAAHYRGGADFTVAPFGNNPIDTWGHGTNVAGVVASSLNDSNGVGVAPEVEIYALKAGDGGTVYASAAAYAMDWAITNGMNITNSSFGSKNPAVKAWLETVYQRAKDAGILNIAGAGNTGTCSGNIDTEPFYPGSFSSVIAVGAVSENNERACFSRVSNDVDISAPGTNIYSTNLNNGYGTFDGTSIATPHVVGAAALLWNLVPDMNHNGRKNDDVESLLLGTASDVGPAGKDPLYGEGILNVLKAYDNIPEETVEESLSLTVNTDKSTLKKGVDTGAHFTLTVKNELNNPVSELENTITVSNVTVGTTLTWSENAPGTYISTIPTSAFQVGENILGISVVDTRGKTANQNITVTLLEEDIIPEVLHTTLSLNKTSFKKGVDTEATLTLLATNEHNTPVIGISQNIVVISPSTIPATTWTEGAPGTYTTSLPLDNLTAQTHTVTVRTTDTRAKVSNSTVSFSLLERDPLPDPEKTLIMSLNSKKPIYTLFTRGKRGDQYITLRLVIKDESGKVVSKVPKTNFIAKLVETGNTLDIFRVREIKKGTYEIKVDKDVLPVKPAENTFQISLEVKDTREVTADTSTEFSTFYKASVAKITSINYTESTPTPLLASPSQAITNSIVINPVVTVADEFGNPIEGAKVTLRIMDGKKILGTKVATSGSDGKATAKFTLKKSGCFTTNVVKITKRGYAFSKGTPENTTCTPTTN